MKEPDFPVNEPERLKALLSYKILDTDAERGFDDLTWLASQVAEVPIALVSLIDRERQWFKSKVGLNAPCTERNISFCGHAILHDEPLIVPNALEDIRFVDNPLVTGDPLIRFYMGVPLKNSQGFNLGTLCVIDRKPRELSPQVIEILTVLARQVVDQLELRYAVHELEEAARKVMRQDRAKTEFLATMSHEIRTPMNGILGMADLIYDQTDDPTQKENIEVIRDSGVTLLRHLNAILDLTKVEAGEIEFEMLDFHLERQLKRVLLPFQVVAENKHIEFLFQYDYSLPTWVTGDPVRLEQVLSNLVNNAVKFTREGMVKVVVSHEGTDEHGVMINFEVWDTGPGVPKDKQKTIFEAYKQSDASVARQHGGTGLGLPIAARLVEMMGGEILVDSQLGKGSCFSFKVSLSPGNEPKREASRDLIQGKSLHVLVVEDNRVNQVVVSKILKRLGHTATIAGSGAEAMQEMSRGMFDVILLDLQLPDMNGYDIMTHVYATQDDLGHSRTPIIALTASVTEKESCEDAGMQGFLSKPVSVASLNQALASVDS